MNSLARGNLLEIRQGTVMLKAKMTVMQKPKVAGMS